VKFRGTIAASSHFTQLPFKSTKFGKMGGSWGLREAHDKEGWGV
jgi:hypothetical protein